MPSFISNQLLLYNLVDYYKAQPVAITEQHILGWVPETARDLRQDFPDATADQIADYLGDQADQKLWVHSLSDSQLKGWCRMVQQEALRALEDED